MHQSLQFITDFGVHADLRDTAIFEALNVNHFAIFAINWLIIRRR